jgi:hypothetical protein
MAIPDRKESPVQPTPIDEHLHRAVADRRPRAERRTAPPRTHPPPRGALRRRAAAVLARLAWRLDRDAALRAWP